MSKGEPMRIELANYEATLMREIADPAMKRLDVAMTKAKEHFDTAIELLYRLRVALELKRSVTDADLRLVQNHIFSGLDAMNGVKKKP